MALCATASADPDDVVGLTGTMSAISRNSALAPLTVVEGPGIKVGEGTVLHPVLGLESGFISNAFYEDTTPRSTGVMRLVAKIATSTLTDERLTPAEDGAVSHPGSMEYRASLQLSYEFYLSGDETLQAQGGLGAGAMLRGTVHPGRTWSFLYLDTFDRVLRATNFESVERTNRDVNRLQLGVRYAPAGRSIDGILHYSNLIDVFEDADQRFASRMQNSAGLTVSWRYRPVTVVFAEATQGVFTGLGDASAKVTSFPLTLTTGIQTLLSMKTSLVARIGYNNGFYASGPSFSAVLGGLQLGHRYSPNGLASLSYQYGHFDSINANYFRDHALVLDLEHRFVPFVVNVRPSLRLRHYEGVTAVAPGPTTRDDVIFSLDATARYNFRNSLGAVLVYRANSVQTDYMSALDGDDPSFVRHEVIAGVRAAL